MGGGGSGKSTSTSTVYTNADPWKGVQPYLSNMYGQTNQLGQTPLQFYPGQGYVPMSALTQGGINQNLNYANQTFPGMYNQTMNTYNNLTNAMDVANNPYVQGMNLASANMFNQAMGQSFADMAKNYANTVAPSIANSAIGQGGFGGTRQGVAEGMAVGNMANAARDVMQSGQANLANMYAQTNLGAYGQGLGAANQAMAFSPQLAELGLLPGQIQQQAGQMGEQYQQQALDWEKAKWDFYQNEPWNRISNMNAIYSGATPYAAQSSQQQMTQPITSNPWASGLAAASGAYGLYSGLMG